ncbi:hypothetical protein EYZ11_008796 [Aspergillus tanneri]|uniref:Uncharacterized protein n=1 Tax=Aspergillus tanneri TaxID=1220188 RepID=A0A4S3J9Z3_9EURO|nr:hypothetical protein EYZ11_008796 [Aspergillus tanneri]
MPVRPIQEIERHSSCAT